MQRPFAGADFFGEDSFCGNPMGHDRELTVFDDGHFRICHCADVDVPGYLIVAAEGEPGAWGDLTGAQRSRLGDVLALAAEAVRAVAGPERVYVCAFGEETPSSRTVLCPPRLERPRRHSGNGAGVAPMVEGTRRTTF